MRLVDYLAKHGATELRAVELRLGGKTFPAAFYTQDGQRRLYVIGERPPVLKRPRKMAIRLNDCSADWYVAAYMDRERMTAEYAPFHPFGPNFLIALWAVPSGEAIDAHNYWRGEHKPYLRIPATWQEVEQ